MAMTENPGGGLDMKIGEAMWEDEFGWQVINLASEIWFSCSCLMSHSSRLASLNAELLMLQNILL